MDSTVVSTVTTGLFGLLTTVLGLRAAGRQRRAEMRAQAAAEDLDRLRALADRQDAVITQRDQDIERLRARIRELESR